MSKFKDELYGANMCYQPDGTVGPKGKFKTSNENTFRSNRLSSGSSLGRKAMDQEELRILQEKFGEFNKLNFT
jgi:hypothetical protein